MKGTPRKMGKGNLRTAMGLAAIYCERKTESSKSNAPRAGGKQRGYQRSVNISRDLHKHVFGKMYANAIKPRWKN